MKKLLSLMALTFSTMSFAENKTITLTESNSVVLETEVNAQSTGIVAHQLLQKHQTLKKDEPIYLILETPGGSVVAGENLIKFIQGIDREVKTITFFAASMGFQIAQASGERLIVTDGIMMSHRANGGIQGDFNGSLEKRGDLWNKILTITDKRSAKRMGISLSKYRDLIKDEYWAVGKHAISDKSADRMVKVTCDSTLLGTRDQIVRGMFGSYKVTRSNCPAIRGFIDIEVLGEGERFNEEKHKLMLWLLDREGFVRRFILKQ